MLRWKTGCLMIQILPDIEGRSSIRAGKLSKTAPELTPCLSSAFPNHSDWRSTKIFSISYSVFPTETEQAFNSSSPILHLNFSFHDILTRHCHHNRNKRYHLIHRLKTSHLSQNSPSFSIMFPTIAGAYHLPFSQQTASIQSSWHL